MSKKELLELLEYALKETDHAIDATIKDGDACSAKFDKLLGIESGLHIALTLIDNEWNENIFINYINRTINS